MGNHIGTINYNPGEIDVSELEKLRKKYGLPLCEETANCESEQGMESYGVEVAGLSILWWGEENVKKAIKSFLYDAEQIYGDKIITTYSFLPM